MKLKQGVNLTGLRPELIIGLMVADTVCKEHGIDMVVTSLCDSVHSQTSLHYSGAAGDIRTHNMLEQEHKILDKIRENLPEDFDVILEKDHIHMEFQPRRKTS